MPEKDQGTGQHKHKSSEEPYPHHEAPSTRGEGGSERSSGSHSSGSHSSGSHTGGQHSSSSSHSSGSESSRRESGSSGRNESGDLKSREYTDSKGEVHHHTHTYEEQHKR